MFQLLQGVRSTDETFAAFISRFGLHGWSPKSSRRSRRPKVVIEQLELRALLTGDVHWAIGAGSTGGDSGDAIGVDTEGNVYTTGTFAGTVDFDPSSGSTTLTSLGGIDIFVTKTSPTGSLIWAKSFRGPGYESASGIAVDGSGNVVVAGSFYGTVDFDPGPFVNNLTSFSNLQTDAFVCKLTSAGQFLWVRNSGGTESDSGEDVAIDSSGNIFVAGAFRGVADLDPGPGVLNRTTDTVDSFVQKLNSNGYLMWSETLEGSGVGRFGSPGLNFTNSLTLDASGNSYVAGYFEGAIENVQALGYRSAFVAMISSTGVQRWVRAMGGTIYTDCQSVAADATGNVYVCGDFQGSGSFGTTTLVNSRGDLGGDGFVSKLNSAGQFLWTRQLEGESSSQLTSIAVDKSGNLFLGGTFDGTIDLDPGVGGFLVDDLSGPVIGMDPDNRLNPDDAFVTSWNTDGQFRWGKSFGGSLHERLTDLAVDSASNVLITGSFAGSADVNLAGSADFDPATGFQLLISSGFADSFILKLSSSFLYTTPGLFTGVLNLRRNGPNLELTRKLTPGGADVEILESQPLNLIRSVRITGRETLTDQVTIDFRSGGSFAIDGGIQFIGGSGGNDLLSLIGAGNEGIAYDPSASIAQSGKFVAYGQDLTFTGLEGTTVHNTQHLFIEPQGSADVLTAASGIGPFGGIGTQITGTSRGIAITPITFDSVAELTVNSGLKDRLLSESNDTIVFNAGSLEADDLTTGCMARLEMISSMAVPAMTS